MRRGTEIGLFIGLTALDQLVKTLTAHHTAMLIPGVIRLNYTENTGFALGLFHGAVNVALVLSALIFIALTVLMFRLPRTSPLRLPLLVMNAGALGNLIDRIALGRVRDMFELLFVRFYVFNPADVYVTLGALCCAIVILRSNRKEQP